MADFSGMIKAIKDWAIGKFITEIPIGSDTAVGAVKADGSTTTIDKDGTIHATGGSGSGTSDYNSLSNRPSIGGVTLSGDKTLSELGIQPEGTYLTEETDPTVPSWAKSPTKPTYSKSEVGLGNVPNVTTDDQTPGFTEATERANIASGEKLSVIFGKVMKWFSDLKPHAFVAPITNLLATVSGNALDATMGKELDDKITANADAIADVKSSLSQIGTISTVFNPDTPIEVDAETKINGVSITLQPGIYILNHLANVSKAEVNNYYMGLEVESGNAVLIGTQATIVGVNAYAVNNLIIARVVEVSVIKTYYKATFSFKVNTDAISAVKLA